MTDTIAPPGDAPSRRLDGLQLGRALAALTVVVGHAVDHAYHHTASEAWQLGARYGVTLFFVISGFIMVQTTGQGRFSPAEFLSRRIRRVVPIYVVVNLIVAVVALVAPNLFQRTVFTWPYLVTSLLFIPVYDPAGTGGIWPLFRLGWTLNFEMFFYVVFALFAFLAAGGRAVALTLFFGTLIAIGQLNSFDSAIPGFYTRIDTLGFVAGVWLGLLNLRRGLIGNGLALAVLVGASTLVLGYILVNYHDVRNVTMTQVWLVAVCTAHVAALLIAIDLRGWTVPKPLLYLGDASYSMYLFHMFAIGAATAIARRLPSELLMPMIVVSAAGGIMIGVLAYRYVETPLNRIMRGRRPLTAAQLGATVPRGRSDVR